MFTAMFLFLVPLPGSDSVNLFSENVHSSTNLREMSLTEISFALQDLSNYNFAKCFTGCKNDSPDEANAMTHWLHSSVSRPLGPFISSGFASIEIYVTIIFYFFFLTAYFLFMFSENFRAAPGSCFQTFFHIYKARKPFFMSAIIYFTEAALCLGVRNTRTRYFRSHNKIRWQNSTNKPQDCSKDREKGLLVPLCRGERAPWVQRFGAQT